MSDFTHFNEQGRAKMVDVGEKPISQRVAVAAGRVLVNENTFGLIQSGGIKKGDVLGTADIIYAEEVIGTVNLVSNEDVEKSTMLAALRAIKNFFASSYMKVVYVIIAAAILIFIIAVIKMNSKGSKKRKIKYVPYDKDEKR